MREQIIQQVKAEKIIVIIRGVSSDRILPVAQALYDGGVRMIEVTFDQKDVEKQKETVECIRKIAEHFQGKVSVGAGTVTSTKLVEMAAEAGAQYIISPDTNEAVIRKTRELGLVSMPGALTPTEVMNAHHWGADFVKLFPVGNLGAGYVKAVKAPLNHVKLLAVGGVNADNVADFLAAGCCGAGVGGNLVNKKWIEAGEYEKLTEAARELMRAVEGKG
ncbi:MAG: bifunctional 4-hydroxy-2-oxoglutarate aldolase/2-dehydro-3-deoxy-phosphogluconate aldolase [Lachnospiraceae bacterium]|nr:bifunctional 4-hydroxy-2-oxoglutarate aldolase/2-dehydro-3-deoxy-phosphogluconate aldolase [Lachnospiraceae bacterium]